MLMSVVQHFLIVAVESNGSFRIVHLHHRQLTPFGAFRCCPELVMLNEKVRTLYSAWSCVLSPSCDCLVPARFRYQVAETESIASIPYTKLLPVAPSWDLDNARLHDVKHTW